MNPVRLTSTALLLLLAACSGSRPPEATGGGAGGGTAGGPSIRVMPSALAFGAVAFPAGPTTQILVVRNVGADRLRLEAPFFDLAPLNAQTAASEFSVTLPTGYDPSVGLAAGKDLLELAVKFTPASLGRKELTLTIHSNDVANPLTQVTITANAEVAPACSTLVAPAGVLNFGILASGSTRDLPVTITNTGGSCALSQIELSAGSDPSFDLVGGPIAGLTLAPSQVLALVVRLTAPASWVPLADVSGSLEFSIAGAARVVPLFASIARIGLTISPSDLNFGTVMKGCSSATRSFTVYNTGTAPIVVTSYSMMAAAGEPAGGPNCPGFSSCPEFLAVSTSPISPNTVLAPGSAPAVFSLRYHPINFGADNGAFLLKVNQGGVMVDYVVTLAGNSDTEGFNTDTFAQEPRPKVDLLIVLDNSSSMAGKQASLATNFGSLIGNLVGTGIDFQIAVTTTDMSVAGGKILGDAANPKILTRTTPDVQNEFLLKIASVGTNGSETEQPLAAAVAALTPPLVSTDNAGLVRPDAQLAVIAVSDGDDESSQLVSTYVGQLLGVKSQAARFSFSAVGPYNPMPAAGCTYDGVSGAPRTLNAVNATNGITEDICWANWSAAFQCSDCSGSRSIFYLTARPASLNTIVVKIDGVVVTATAPNGAPVWFYDSTGQSVNFEPLFVPQPGTRLTIAYPVACVP